MRKRYFDIYSQAKDKKKPKTLYSNIVFHFLQGYELKILKLIYVYSRIEQISQYIVDETQDFSLAKGITNKNEVKLEQTL